MGQCDEDCMPWRYSGWLNWLNALRVEPFCSTEVSCLLIQQHYTENAVFPYFNISLVNFIADMLKYLSTQVLEPACWLSSGNRSIDVGLHHSISRTRVTFSVQEIEQLFKNGFRELRRWFITSLCSLCVWIDTTFWGSIHIVHFPKLHISCRSHSPLIGQRIHILRFVIFKRFCVIGMRIWHVCFVSLYTGLFKTHFHHLFPWILCQTVVEGRGYLWSLT